MTSLAGVGELEVRASIALGGSASFEDVWKIKAETSLTDFYRIGIEIPLADVERLRV